MTILKLGCLNLHIGNGTQYVWRGVNPMPAAPCPTFAFNDQNTYKHQHALNAFVLDLVKSRDSCNNNNSNNNNNNNNNIHAMTSLTMPSLTLTLHLMTLTLHLMTLTPRVVKHARPDTNYHTYQFYYPHYALWL